MRQLDAVRAWAITLGCGNNCQLEEALFDIWALVSPSTRTIRFSSADGQQKMCHLQPSPMSEFVFGRETSSFIVHMTEREVDQLNLGFKSDQVQSDFLQLKIRTAMILRKPFTKQLGTHFKQIFDQEHEEY